MHSNTHFHKLRLGLSWDPANVALTVLVVLFFLIFLFLFLTLCAPAAAAQNSVPPTAVQAAKMPQFAAKLHARSSQNASRLPAAKPRASYKNPHDPRSRGVRPLDSNDVYDNGPINGTTDAWAINLGMAAADTFTMAANGTVN